MSYCVTTGQPVVAYTPIAQSRVEYKADAIYAFFCPKLKEIAPNSYEFLSLWTEKSIAITQKGVSKENENQMQKNTIKQITASLSIFALSLGYYSMSYFSATLASLPVCFLVSKLTNCANEQIKTKEIDTSLVEDSTIKAEVLKGGILFFKAWQKVNQKKDHIFFTSSGESRFSVLESTPPLKGRITQLEEKLKNLGEQWECTEADQEIIEGIEKLFYSNA